MQRNMTCVLTLLIAVVAGLPAAAADYWDKPASASSFSGDLIGKVKWVPQHTTNWFVFVVDEVKPGDGNAAAHQDIVGKSVRISIGKWKSASQADPELSRFISELKPAQALTMSVNGKSDSTFEFSTLPDGGRELLQQSKAGRVEEGATQGLDAFTQSLHFDELNGLHKVNWLLGKTQNQVLDRRSWNFQQLSGKASASLVKVSDQTFEQAIRIDVQEPAEPGWKVHVQWSGDSPVAEGDVLWGVIHYRVPEAEHPYGNIFVKLEQTQKYDGRNSHLVQETYTPEVGSGWHKAYVNGRVRSDTDIKLVVFVGYQKQVVEIGGVSLVNLGPDAVEAELPSAEVTLEYQGRAENAPWRAEAHKRIAQHRMSDLTIRVLDEAGSPVPQAQVEVKQTSHAFGFGTATMPFEFRRGRDQYRTRDMRSVMYTDTKAGELYKQHLAELFNFVTTDPSWRIWDYRSEQSIEHLKLVKSLGIDRILVHNILYPRVDQVPNDLKEASDPELLKQRLFENVRNRVPVIRDYVYGYDVINEMFASKFFEERFRDKYGEEEGEKRYYDFVAELFKLVHELHPEAKLVINEARTEVTENVVRREYLLGILAELESRGAEVDGIGVQGHVGEMGDNWHPEQLLAIFDQLSKGGKYKLHISEFDTKVRGGSAKAYEESGNPDNEIARYEADLMRDMLLITFSHPDTDAFIMWDFWDGRHWKDNAPLFYEDWTPKPAYQVWKDLVLGQWRTDTTLTTGADGSAAVRGYRGDYKITVRSADGREQSTTLTLGDDGEEAQIRLPRP